MLHEITDIIVKLYYSYIVDGRPLVFLQVIHDIFDLTVQCAADPTLSKLRKIKRIISNASN